MPPEVLGRLMPQILAEPTFRSTRRGQSGISKRRLVGLRPPTWSSRMRASWWSGSTGRACWPP